MPQKTVYIRDEDLPLWEEAAKLSDGSLASVLADALRAHVERHSAVTQDSPQEGRAIAAPHGEKMIQLDVRLFTDAVAGRARSFPSTLGTPVWSQSRPIQATGLGKVSRFRSTHFSNCP
jgi:hypothetical protein